MVFDNGKIISDEDFVRSAPAIAGANVVTSKEIEKMENLTIVNNTKNYSPRITFWGCGGFGVDRIKDLPKLLNYSNAEYRIIDTSRANTHGQNIDAEIEITYLGDSGHGKLRGTNLNTIKQKLEQIVYTSDNESDIDVLLFSLAGGSGSVIGPLIIQALTKKDRPIIIITVAEAKSTVDCENSIKTIKTIEGMSVDNYVNMILFDNSIDGEAVVDEAINKKLKMLTKAINLNHVRILDKSDVVVAMRPYHHGILSGVRGLYVMRIDDDCPFCYDNEEIMTCHSSILVGEPTQDIKTKMNKIHTSIHYDGKWMQPDNPILIQFGLPISDTFLKKFDNNLKKAQAASGSHNVQSTIDVSGASKHSTGIII